MPLLLSPLTPIFDLEGRLAVGARVRVFRSGAGSTPADAYMDAAFNVKYPEVIETERGVLPPVYVAGGDYRVEAVSELGALLSNVDGITVVAPSSGGGDGGGDPADPTSVFATGDIKARYGTGVLSGWVRLNGRTIGSANSGATERANADCEALFKHLYVQDANLAVSGGRGADADEDWAADKSIALPDGRGRVLAALGGMGAVIATRLEGAVFDFGSLDALGSYGGRGVATLTVNQLPLHDHTVTATASAAAGHSHDATTSNAGQHNHGVAVASAGVHDHNATATPAGNHTHEYGSPQSKLGTAGSGGTNTNLWFGATTTQNTSADGAHGHAINVANAGAHSHDASSTQAGQHNHTLTTSVAGSHGHVITASAGPTGLGLPHNNAQPFLLVTYYIKL